MNPSNFPFLGFGLGLRGPHIDEVIQSGSQAEWFEVISENYMGVPGLGYGHALTRLEKVRENFPIVLHGVSMTIGSIEPLNKNYFKHLKNLIDIIQPTWVSDHICWTSHGVHNSYDLLPLPYNEETLEHLTQRILEAQELVGRQLVFENASTYLEFNTSDMQEWNFLTQLTKKTGCKLLLDLNNIYVCSQNHNFDPYTYLDNVPWESVVQIHLAGFIDNGKLLIDTHSKPVCPEVWQMLEYVYKNYKTPSTMVEWDSSIPTLAELEEELQKAKDIKGKLYEFKQNSNPSL